MQIDKTLLGIDKDAYSLHDSLLKEISINFISKEISLIVELYLEKNRNIKILLSDIVQFSGILTNDFKNKEVLLDFKFQDNILKIYTSSDSSISIEYGKCYIDNI
jgi:hypothetical protein